jgi:hypothetical protein
VRHRASAHVCPVAQSFEVTHSTQRCVVVLQTEPFGQSSEFLHAVKGTHVDRTQSADVPQSALVTHSTQVPALRSQMARLPGADVQSRLVRQETSPASVLRPPEPPTAEPPCDAPPLDGFDSPPAPSPPVDTFALPSGFLAGNAPFPSSDPEHAKTVVPIPTRIRSTEYLMIQPG